MTLIYRDQIARILLNDQGEPIFDDSCCCDEPVVPDCLGLVSFEVDREGSRPLSSCEATFTPQVTVPDGCEIVRYSWDFGDGSEGSSEENPVHRYADPGYWTACLTVTFRCGGAEFDCEFCRRFPCFFEDCVCPEFFDWAGFFGGIDCESDFIPGGGCGGDPEHDQCTQVDWNIGLRDGCPNECIKDVSFSIASVPGDWDGSGCPFFCYESPVQIGNDCRSATATQIIQYDSLQRYGCCVINIVLLSELCSYGTEDTGRITPCIPNA